MANVKKLWVKVVVADGRTYFTVALTRTGRGALTSDITDGTAHLSAHGLANLELAKASPGQWVRVDE